jgi:polyhydroxyalkanoate synthesis regulator phasin
MTIDKDLIDRLRTRGEEMFTQVSAELMSNPRFMKAMEGAMRGKEAAEDAAARAIKSMNIPTRTEFKKALKRIDALEKDLATLEAELKAAWKTRPVARRKKAAKKPTRKSAKKAG